MFMLDPREETIKLMQVVIKGSPMDKQNYISQLEANSKNYKFLDLAKIAKDANLELEKLPLTHRVLLENTLRNTRNSEEFTEVIAKLKHG